jgi:hypothetical protein
VAGTSGAGKSAVFRQLRTLGHHAVSTDSVEGLCRWVDAAGAPVSRPVSPSLEWLAGHRWSWDLSRFDSMLRFMAETVGSRSETLYVCGSAANDDRVGFDATVLLDIDEATMVSRVLDPARVNDFGRCGDSLASLVAGLPQVRARYLNRGAITVDATAPLSTVVASVLSA